MMEETLPRDEGSTDPLETRELLTEVVRALVAQPEQVRIEEEGQETNTSTFTIHVAEGDLGKVIGRAGRVVQLLRTLFGSIEAIEGRRVSIQIAGCGDARKTGRASHVRPRAA